MAHIQMLRICFVLMITLVVIYHLVYQIYVENVRGTDDNNYTRAAVMMAAHGNTGNISADDYNSKEDYSSDILKRAAFEGDIVDCSVDVFTSDEKKGFKNYLHRTNPDNVTCSRDIFNDYFKEKGRFYGDGAWYVTDEKNIVADFYPTGCSFSNSHFESSKLGKCFGKLNVSKILVSGDSNGNRYFQQLLSLLSAIFTCELDTTRGVEDGDKHNQYFKIPDRPYIWRRPGCPHCLSQTHHCLDKTSQAKTSLEFVGIVQFIDERVSLRGNGTFPPPFLEAHTFIELLTRHYLQYHGYPDLWIITSPLHHESWFQNLEQFQVNFKNFVNVLDHHLPPKTKVLILTDMRECSYRVPRQFHKKWREMWPGKGRNEIFNAMNQIIFDTLEDRILRKHSRYIGFLDLGRILCPFSCMWHEDGGHMQPNVYKLIWDYIFQYVCS